MTSDYIILNEKECTKQKKDNRVIYFKLKLGYNINRKFSL